MLMSLEVNYACHCISSCLPHLRRGRNVLERERRNEVRDSRLNGCLNFCKVGDRREEEDCTVLAQVTISSAVYRRSKDGKSKMNLSLVWYPAKAYSCPYTLPTRFLPKNLSLLYLNSFSDFLVSNFSHVSSNVSYQ